MAFKLYASKRKNKRRKFKRRRQRRERKLLFNYMTVYTTTFKKTWLYTNTYKHFFQVIKLMWRRYRKADFFYYYTLLQKPFTFRGKSVLMSRYYHTRYLGIGYVTVANKLYCYNKIIKLLKTHRLFCFNYFYFYTVLNFYRLHILNKVDFTVTGVTTYNKSTLEVAFVNISNYQYPKWVFLHKYLNKNWWKNIHGNSLILGDVWNIRCASIKLYLFYYKLYTLNLLKI